MSYVRLCAHIRSFRPASVDGDGESGGVFQLVHVSATFARIELI